MIIILKYLLLKTFPKILVLDLGKQNSTKDVQMLLSYSTNIGKENIVHLRFITYKKL